MSKPLLLICNDDGIHAPGIRALVEAVKDLGDLVVVAPDRPQSGMGHAITIGFPLRVQAQEGLFGPEIPAYQTSGTPVDCVKLAVDRIMHRKPDLLLSGINHGSNASINVIYSGTMSAAVEGAIEGIPSVGFSLRLCFGGGFWISGPSGPSSGRAGLEPRVDAGFFVKC